jgi:acyl-CoA thioesterase-2
MRQDTDHPGRPLVELVALLTLTRVGEDCFVGASHDLGFPQVFGGQVLGQALAAATSTVDPTRPAHSLHGYFLRPGDAQADIEYCVDRSRDGSSFTTRRVVATQHGRPIFHLAASFQRAEDGFDHQPTAPVVPGPEGLASELELTRAVADRLPDRVREIWTRDRPIEIRPVDPGDPFRPARREPAQYAWVRAVGEVADDDALHRCLLAYLSDFKLLGSALRPHGVSYLTGEVQMASLDHAMWFHRPFRVHDWLLYAMDSPSASGARGLARGSLFDRHGRLVASVAQEGLMRPRRPPEVH